MWPPANSIGSRTSITPMAPLSSWRASSWAVRRTGWLMVVGFIALSVQMVSVPLMSARL
jgi:hypothetical protein